VTHLFCSIGLQMGKAGAEGKAKKLDEHMKGLPTAVKQELAGGCCLCKCPCPWACRLARVCCLAHCFLAHFCLAHCCSHVLTCPAISRTAG
jgi:hypothetical protein